MQSELRLTRAATVDSPDEGYLIALRPIRSVTARRFPGSVWP